MTGWGQLVRDAIAADRVNRLEPNGLKRSLVLDVVLSGSPGPLVGVGGEVTSWRIRTPRSHAIAHQLRSLWIA